MESLAINVFLSSNSHSGIIVSSVSFLKLWTVSIKKKDEKQAFQHVSQFSIFLYQN